MNYVISDIHGCYQQYKEILCDINFSSKDRLYVIGDILDRGPYPIAILQHMLSMPNIYPIMGNHEQMALPTLRAIASGNQPIPTDFMIWGCTDNASTLSGFHKLHNKNKMRFVNYIENFPMYRTVTVNDKIYVMIHAGIDYDEFDENKPLENYAWDKMVWAETDYDKVYYKDKILITGHTPTTLIDEKSSGCIIRKNNHIAIDCGCAYGGKLGCVCLETGEEFYAF